MKTALLYDRKDYHDDMGKMINFFCSRGNFAILMYNHGYRAQVYLSSDTIYGTGATPLAAMQCLFRRLTERRGK